MREGQKILENFPAVWKKLVRTEVEVDQWTCEAVVVGTVHDVIVTGGSYVRVSVGVHVDVIARNWVGICI